MKNFSDYIEQLLIRHDYVIVPGFGGFVLQQQPAYIHNGTILPPIQTIGFNPLLQHGDGLLAMEIVREERITYRSALAYIEKQIEYLQANLRVSDKLAFGKLGTMQMSFNGHLSFKPTANPDFLPANFGLSKVVIPDMGHDEEKKIRISIPSKRLYRYAAVAALVIGLLFVSPHKTNVGQIDYADLLQAPRTLFYDSVQEINDVTIVEELVVTPQNFHVIVAATTHLMAAETFCNQLKIEHFEHAHVLSPSRNYHIAIQSFTDEQEAIDYMKHLRRTDNRFEDAWVLFVP